MISKQTQKALTYIFAILAMVLGSIFLVAMAQGYRYDFLTGQIKESGLVLIDSRPNGADIYINGTRNKNATPYRLTNAQLGPMNIELVRPEFRVWKKSLTVEAQQVSFANYALLLPQKLGYQDWLPEYNFAQIVQSGDQRRSFAISTKPETAVWQLNGSETPTKLYTPQPNSGPLTITDLRVNEKGSRQIITQTSGTVTQTIVITDKDSSLNLTANLQVSGGSFVFHPTDDNALYWLSPEKALRRIDIASQTLGPVLAQNVLAFTPYDNQVFAVLGPDANSTRNALWRIDGSNSDKSRRPILIPQSSTYSLKRDEDRAGEYIAMLALETKELVIIRDPNGQKPLTGLLSKSATAYTISNNGQRIIYNAGDKLKTYDLEQAERFDFGVSLASLQAWSWYDDNHIIVVANGQLRLIDYDGQNDQIISDRGDNVGFSSFRRSDDIIFYTNAGFLKEVKLTQD